MIAAENQSVLSAFMVVVLTGRVAAPATRPKGVISDGAQIVLFHNLRFKIYYRNAVLVLVVRIS
jgi:hypothetical protein